MRKNIENHNKKKMPCFIREYIKFLLFLFWECLSIVIALKNNNLFLLIITMIVFPIFYRILTLFGLKKAVTHMDVEDWKNVRKLELYCYPIFVISVVILCFIMKPILFH